MPVTVRELADLVHGTVHGEADTPITDAHSLAHAGPGHITFLESERNVRQLAASQASAVVVPANFPVAERTAIRVADPLTAFVAIVERLRGKASLPAAGVDPRAVIDPSAVLGPNCSIQALAHVGANSVLGARCRIYPGVVIGRDCRIGDDVTIFPNAVIYDGTVLGNRVIVHGNAVIGADGFGYRLHQGKHVKVPQLGNVVIGDDVEIGACSSVDRGTFDATTVGPGTKLDNQVQIGHNCTIGPHNLIVSQVGIAGSCSTGAYVVIAGQAGLADHIHIGDQVVLGARSGVTNDLIEPGRYFGAPATPERDQKRMLASLLKLPEMRRDLLRIKKHLDLSDETEAGAAQLAAPTKGRSGEPSRTSADGAARLAAPTSDEAAA